MTTEPKVSYEFGPFRVDPDKQVLLRENQPVAVTPKAFETLLVLIRHSREVVSKDDLMKAVWPDAFVEESNLSQNIFMLRKALGDASEDRRYIVTLPGRGYRFAASVRTVTEDSENLVIASRSRSQIVVEDAESVAPASTKIVRATLFGTTAWKYILQIGAVTALVTLGAVFFLSRHRPTVLGDKDAVLIADFTNTTGDPVFDGTLRQGLSVQLEQSPYLSLISQDRIQQALSLMGQPADAPLAPKLAREVCERTAGAAVLEGSIAALGSHYVLGLRATNCRTGSTLVEEQREAARKEDVLKVLSQISSNFRRRIGESLNSIRQHDTPLEEATTSSLEALKAYSAARQMKYMPAGYQSQVPLLKRAVELDPNFATAHAFLGRVYGDTGNSVLSAEHTTRAFQLRNRAGDRERFFIEVTYHRQVTGNLEKSRQALELWAQIYPRDKDAHGLLSGFTSQGAGRYSEAIEEANKALAIDPDLVPAYANIAFANFYLDRLADAENILQQGSQRRLETPDYMFLRYYIAFLNGDEAEMNRQAALGESKAGAEDWMLYAESLTVARAGQAQRARKMVRRAMDLAQQGGQEERASIFAAGAAVWESLFGNLPLARQRAAEALKLSHSRDAEYGAAFALTASGELSSAQALVSDLENRFPDDTCVRFNYVPTLHALLTLKRGQPAQAIEQLQSSAPYESAVPGVDYYYYFGGLYSAYVRGEAYLVLRQGADAAEEFQKILAHRGIVAGDPVGALAYLQIGRAYALMGDSTKAKSAYQDFLDIWKNADPDIPLLKYAKSESARFR